jgi:hypothetical protein
MGSFRKSSFGLLGNYEYIDQDFLHCMLLKSVDASQKPDKITCFIAGEIGTGSAGLVHCEHWSGGLIS